MVTFNSSRRPYGSYCCCCWPCLLDDGGVLLLDFVCRDSLADDESFWLFFDGFSDADFVTEMADDDDDVDVEEVGVGVGSAPI